MKLSKIVFPLNPDDWHGQSTETVWAEKENKNCYAVRNVPFHVKGIALDDLISVKIVKGILCFDKVTERSGHSTYRILIDKKNMTVEFPKYWEPLEKLGCTYETAEIGKMCLIAVDAPKGTDINDVFRLLELGEEAKVWSFEEGYFGHASK